MLTNIVQRSQQVLFHLILSPFIQVAGLFGFTVFAFTPRDHFGRAHDSIIHCHRQKNVRGGFCLCRSKRDVFCTSQQIFAHLDVQSSQMWAGSLPCLPVRCGKKLCSLPVQASVGRVCTRTKRRSNRISCARRGGHEQSGRYHDGGGCRCYG